MYEGTNVIDTLDGAIAATGQDERIALPEKMALETHEPVVYTVTKDDTHAEPMQNTALPAIYSTPSVTDLPSTAPDFPVDADVAPDLPESTPSIPSTPSTPSGPPTPSVPATRSKQRYVLPSEQGISSLSELQDLEVLRTEFTTSYYKPKASFSYDKITFSRSCLHLLPGTHYVNVLIDRVKKRVIILPVSKYAKDALRWCGVTKEGDVKPRDCTAKKFGEKLYDMMRWVKENKYRVLAYYQVIEGVQLLVFNLREYEMVVPYYTTTAGGKTVKRGKVILSSEMEHGFGMPLAEHSEANAVELNAHYTLSDKDVDMTIADVRVKGRAPTDEEIIMSQYRKEKEPEVATGGQQRDNN